MRVLTLGFSVVSVTPHFLPPYFSVQYETAGLSLFWLMCVAGNEKVARNGVVVVVWGGRSVDVNGSDRWKETPYWGQLAVAMTRSSSSCSSGGRDFGVKTKLRDEKDEKQQKKIFMILVLCYHFPSYVDSARTQQVSEVKTDLNSQPIPSASVLSWSLQNS